MRSPSPLRGPVGYALAAAVLFGVVNVAWRFGHGPVATLAATRAFAGLVLFAPLVWGTARAGSLTALLKDRGAWPAVLLSGSSVWTAAFLFRTVPGPVAAAVIGVAPVVALLAGRLVGSRRIPGRAAVAVVVCAAAAVFAAGPDALTGAALLSALLFLVTDVASVLAAEAARRRHDAAALTVGGLVIGALPAPLLWLGTPAALGGLVVAVVVAGLGTAGRWMRSHALGQLNAAVVASSTQVTALATAVGGALVFSDELGPARLVALLVACAAAVAALTWSAPDRPGTPGTGQSGAAGGAVPRERRKEA